MNVKLRFIRFKEKLTHWEYWPFEIVYFPVILYYLYLSLKARSFFFFSASNPSIPGGGLTGESKGDILDLIPDRWKAKTIRVSIGEHSKEELQKHVQTLGLPLIAKPDIGERGLNVKIIKSVEELESYLAAFSNQNFLLQEYITFPLELGIFYYRFPDQPKGVISSVTSKEFLSIVGDGMSTTLELVQQNKRALFQYHRLEELLEQEPTYIPTSGEKIILEPIGNHSRGTMFLNQESKINQALHALFDEISSSIEGFYFGRFDLRCTSWDDLYQGKNIKIMELNGAGSEPAHIYQPGYSYFKGIRTLLFHWKILYKISVQNYRKGISYMGYKEWRKLKKRTV